MKNYLLVLFVIFIAFQAVAQDKSVPKFRSEAMSTRITDDYGNWEDWTEWIESDVLIVFKPKQTVIYSVEKQMYDLIRTGEKYEQNGWVVYPFYCVDAYGEVCRTEIRTREDLIQLYVWYPDAALLYQIIPVN
jgi:hypothetical protein